MAAQAGVERRRIIATFAPQTVLIWIMVRRRNCPSCGFIRVYEAELTSEIYNLRVVSAVLFGSVDHTW